MRQKRNAGTFARREKPNSISPRFLAHPRPSVGYVLLREHLLLYARTDLFLNNAAAFIIRLSARRRSAHCMQRSDNFAFFVCNYFPLLSLDARDRPGRSSSFAPYRIYRSCAREADSFLSYRNYFKILIINLSL